MGSPQWAAWTNKTEQYHLTSLTQVMSEYFRGYSAGDVGRGYEDDYVAQRGYPGTLAPGETYQDDAPARDLPKFVVHPWPAVQEAPAYVRWAPAHPLCYPTSVWCALSGLYKEVCLLVISLCYLFVYLLTYYSFSCLFIARISLKKSSAK